MKTPMIAIVSFPGNNCEVESLRAIKKAGMNARFFRWNDDLSTLSDVDGYFVPGGFSYEDRGRSGMVAARDSLMQFIAEEAAKGKVVIGNCNGAQILVESGLIPLDAGLRMSLARNALGDQSVGFINEWVWIKPAAGKDRCATSNWNGAMHLPLAHGEGRFVTKDKDVMEELKKNNQIAFVYTDEQGNESTDPDVTPNGSTLGIAGICNPAGNVVALMPHPERTPNGDVYFASMKQWILQKGMTPSHVSSYSYNWSVPTRNPQDLEIFIETIITNNEERTVEQAAKRIVSGLQLKQLKFFSSKEKGTAEILSDLSIFNPNKERAYIRRGTSAFKWNAEKKTEEALSESPLEKGIALLRKEEPDTGATAMGKGGESGVCYVCTGLADTDLNSPQLLEIFANPHASSLERFV